MICVMKWLILVQVSFETKVNLEGRKARRNCLSSNQLYLNSVRLKEEIIQKENHYLINLVSFYLSLYDFLVEMWMQKTM